VFQGITLCVDYSMQQLLLLVVLLLLGPHLEKEVLGVSKRLEKQVASN